MPLRRVLAWRPSTVLNLPEGLRANVPDSRGAEHGGSPTAPAFLHDPRTHPARVVVIGVAGKHNRSAHDSRVGTGLPLTKILSLSQRVLLAVLAAAATAAAGAQRH